MGHYSFVLFVFVPKLVLSFVPNWGCLDYILGRVQQINSKSHIWRRKPFFFLHFKHSSTNTEMTLCVCLYKISNFSIVLGAFVYLSCRGQQAFIRRKLFFRWAFISDFLCLSSGAGAACSSFSGCSAGLWDIRFIWCQFKYEQISLFQPKTVSVRFDFIEI